MAYNKEYYEDKKKKLVEKFEIKKNNFLATIINLVANFQIEAKDIQDNYKEIEKNEEEFKSEESELKEENV